jgi:hypothetical protein
MLIACLVNHNGAPLPGFFKSVDSKSGYGRYYRTFRTSVDSKLVSYGRVEDGEINSPLPSERHGSKDPPLQVKNHIPSYGLCCSGVPRLRRWSNLGRRLGRGRRHETGGRPLAPGISARSIGVFVLDELDGLVRGVTEKGQGDCGLGFNVAASDGGKDAAEGGGEIRGG